MLVRATIVMLIVLNIGAAAWWLLHDERVAVAPHAAPGIPQLRLLDEAPARPPASAPTPVRAKAVATRAAAAPVVAATAAGTARCEGDAAGADGWRVYLPPLASLAAADAVAARIDAAGFSDYLVMREGSDANGVALGRYGTRDAAQRHVAALRAAGFAARCARIAAQTPA
jgi:hypothetical protein